jgi:hypothetical protein
VESPPESLVLYAIILPLSTWRLVQAFGLKSRGRAFFSVIRRLAAFQIVFLAPNGWTSVIERLPLGRHHSLAVALAIPNVVLIGANIPGRFSQ